MTRYRPSSAEDCPEHPTTGASDLGVGTFPGKYGISFREYTARYSPGDIEGAARSDRARG